MDEASPPSQKRRPRDDATGEKACGPEAAIPSCSMRRTVQTPHHGTISYLEAGSGGGGAESSSDGCGSPTPCSVTTVLFLHGIQGSGRSFRLQLNHLADLVGRGACRIISMDLPGYGETSPCDSPIRAGHGVKSDREDDESVFPLHDAAYLGPYYADAVAALLDDLSVSRLSMLVGHSMGGIVAQLFAGRHPRRLERLVVSSSYVGDGRSACDDALDAKWTKRLDDLRGLPSEQYGLARARGMVADPDAADSVTVVEELASIAAEVTEAGLRGGCNLLHVVNTTGVLRLMKSQQVGGLTPPTRVLVLIGERDKVVTPAQSREVAEILRAQIQSSKADASLGDQISEATVRCRIQLSPKVAHAAYLEDPKLYNRILEEFLEE